MNLDPQTVRQTALIVSAALRDDDTSVRLILHTLPPHIAAAVTEASVLAMAELLRDHVPADAIADAVRGAQGIAQTEATGRN
ncbi:hypothetical protein ACFVMA_13955 [Streptomyces rochei]|uniref:hypothetical protein n=1 Tax=Streptomyces rochei TaxID=1928 RepID=UPI0036C5F7B0